MKIDQSTALAIFIAVYLLAVVALILYKKNKIRTKWFKADWSIVKGMIDITFAGYTLALVVMLIVKCTLSLFS